MPTYQKLGTEPSMPEYSIFQPDSQTSNRTVTNIQNSRVEHVILSKDPVIPDTEHARFLRRLMNEQWLPCSPYRPNPPNSRLKIVDFRLTRRS
jgi:hypothetical protein